MRITIQHMIENTKGEFWEVARILRLVPAWCVYDVIYDIR